MWRSIEQYWLYEWCDVNWSDWEGCDHWASDNVTVRSGRKSVWLVRQHGAHHEGSGVPEDQRPKQPVRDHSECGIWVWPGGVMIRALNSGVTIIFGPSGKHSLRAVVHLWTSNASSNRRFGLPMVSYATGFKLTILRFDSWLFCCQVTHVRLHISLCRCYALAGKVLQSVATICLFPLQLLYQLASDVDILACLCMTTARWG